MSTLDTWIAFLDREADAAATLSRHHGCSDEAWEKERARLNFERLARFTEIATHLRAERMRKRQIEADWS